MPPDVPAIPDHVYAELKAISSACLRREGSQHTLLTTDLAHQAYLRCQAQMGASVVQHEHFLHLAARMMRRILVDFARARLAHKRGGTWQRVDFDHAFLVSEERLPEVLPVHRALDVLAEEDPQSAEIIEMKYFGGMTESQIAAVMGRSDRWVRGRASFAKAYLRRYLQQRQQTEQDLARG